MSDKWNDPEYVRKYNREKRAADRAAMTPEQRALENEKRKVWDKRTRDKPQTHARVNRRNRERRISDPEWAAREHARIMEYKALHPESVRAASARYVEKIGRETINARRRQRYARTHSG